MMHIEQALSQAELLIRQNQTSQARAILGEILRENPQNEEAWILSAQVSDKPQQVLYCLRQAIKINPASSRAQLLLDRLNLPQTPAVPVTPPVPVISSQPAQPPLEDTQPHQALPLAAAQPLQEAPLQSAIAYSEPEENTTAPEKIATVEQTSAPTGNTSPATRLATQVAAPKRPMRWLVRILTIAASASLLAPWITIVNADKTTRTLNGLEVLVGPIFSPLGVDVVIASLALLACVALPLLMFFRFRSAATQKWGERATIALAPLAGVLCLDMVSFYYAGLTNNVGLLWGIWASFAFYSLLGLSALINAFRLGSAGRMEISAVRAGRTFTWLFSLGDILALGVTILGLMVMGKFSPFGIAIPAIWLLLGALLSHIV
jgi:hypothetical protein